MERVNTHFLYETGQKIHPISTLKGAGLGHVATSIPETWNILFIAQSALQTMLAQKLLQLRTCVQSAQALDREISNCLTYVGPSSDGNQRELGWFECYNLTEALKKFEAVLQAELSIADSYFITKKGAYDTTDLIIYGERAFPSSLALKVPEAIFDCREATKCIAFELWTAAGFHLHRANEVVLVKYWNQVSDGKQKPRDRNMGTFLREMEKEDPKIGSPKVRAALRDIKDMHRNPLIHPDQALQTCDEALLLLGAINNVIAEMLKEIPEPDSNSINVLVAAMTGKGTA